MSIWNSLIISTLHDVHCNRAAGRVIRRAAAEAEANCYTRRGSVGAVGGATGQGSHHRIVVDGAWACDTKFGSVAVVEGGPKQKVYAYCCGG